MGSKIKAWLQSLWLKLNTDLKALWKDDKVFIIAFAVIIAVIKFRQALIGILVASSKNLFNSTQKISDALQQKEKASNDQANQLVQDSEKLSDSEDPVTDDWNVGK